MSAIDQLFTEAQPNQTSCFYLPLTHVEPCSGIHGRYVKLVCVDADDLPIEATADQKHFRLLEPYVEELRKARSETPGEYPVVPVFKGNDGRWRFSWLAAQKDHPHLANPEADAPENVDRAFRLQVSVPGTLAYRFKRVAAQRGIPHTDLLLTLIREAVS